MWGYSQSSGVWDWDGAYMGTGYSGHGEGRNNPDMQEVHEVGPIPRGLWEILLPPFDTESHGPFVIRLLPASSTKTFGRSGFLIHGDSKENPGQASIGCLILPRAVRESIAANASESGDRMLTVKE